MSNMKAWFCYPMYLLPPMFETFIVLLDGRAASLPLLETA